MTIKIQTKSDSHRSLILDALRILAWQSYKQDNNVRGLEGYEVFLAEWSEHEVHTYKLPQLLKFIENLEYTQEELMKIRSEYYEQRRDTNNNINNNKTTGKGQNVTYQNYKEPPY